MNKIMQTKSEIEMAVMTIDGSKGHNVFWMIAAAVLLAGGSMTFMAPAR